MRPPRRMTPGARGRRALLVDALLALALALVVLTLAAGLGVVAFVCLPLLLLGLLWVGAERLARWIRLRRGPVDRSREASRR
jgi:hypothetical protein